jgi:hypothetical protein
VLFLLVLSVWRLVLGLVIFTSPAMAPPREVAVGVKSGRSAAPFPPIQSGPSDLNLTARIRRYRFAGDFAKETLKFLSIEPAVLKRKAQSTL